MNLHAQHQVFKLDKVLSVCECLTEIQKKRLIKELGISTSSEPPIDCGPDQALLIWTADFLEILTYMTVDQRWYVFDKLVNKLENVGLNLYRAYLSAQKELYAVSVGIADRRYVAVSGYDSLLDIVDMKEIQGCNKQFFETHQYNLTTLFMMRLHKMNSIKDDSNATSKDLR
jgi:hypothetical protein